ncbi:hypothetical protein P7K49_035290 [Saguinus oedipus]|uniref:Ig-like domain-containing protein n=1 Tax=Saguinus oedipus TaxID=9490 RepID=A0ABQ9TM68_SAGOE|nr:hypothetical protein P7K49_035290 [Saguinus oedipus]
MFFFGELKIEKQILKPNESDTLLKSHVSVCLPDIRNHSAAGMQSARHNTGTVPGTKGRGQPKVAFAKEQPARREVQAEAGASATLSCEVAQAQTEVTWYKDGKRLSSSSKVRVEAVGGTRRLVVQQVDQADAGEYSCEAGGQRLSFRLHVAGQCFGDAALPGEEPLLTRSWSELH